MGMTSKEYHEGYQQGFKDAKTDYKNCLKVDKMTMLTELQLEIEEVKTQSGFDEAWDGAVKQCSEIIQQKIDKLKRENE